MYKSLKDFFVSLTIYESQHPMPFSLFPLNDQIQWGRIEETLDLWNDSVALPFIS